MPKGWRPRGVTPRPRSGGAAERSYPTSEVGGVAERRYPTSEVRGGDERNYPASEVRGGDQRSYLASGVRGGGREDQPHVQGAMAVGVQEGLEELSHVEGQEGRQ